MTLYVLHDTEYRDDPEYPSTVIRAAVTEKADADRLVRLFGWACDTIEADDATLLAIPEDGRAQYGVVVHRHGGRGWYAGSGRELDADLYEPGVVRRGVAPVDRDDLFLWAYGVVAYSPEEAKSAVIAYHEAHDRDDPSLAEKPVEPTPLRPGQMLVEVTSDMLFRDGFAETPDDSE